MEAGLMRAFCIALATTLALSTGRMALADGRCDLNGLVGYQILFAKPIEGYIQDGLKRKGYQGCEPDRGTGVLRQHRCSVQGPGPSDRRWSAYRLSVYSQPG